MQRCLYYFCDSKCQLFKTNYAACVVENDEPHVLDSLSSAAVSGKFSDRNEVFDTAKLSLAFSAVSSVQTDFTEVSKFYGPYQKVVRFGPHAEFMVTGGADGHVRVWQLPTLNKLTDIRAYTTDVDDLDVSPNGESIVSVGRGGGAHVWQTNDGSERCELTKHSDGCFVPKGYRFRFCRFLSTVAGDRTPPQDECVFVTCSIPLQRSAAKSDCFLTVWQLKHNSCRPSMCNKCTDEVVCSMCISSCRRYIGLGSMDGSVTIIRSTDLTLLKCWKQTHRIFVTSLDFLPTEPPSFSVSADNACQLHTVPTRQYCTLAKFFMLMSLLLVALHLLIQYLGIFSPTT
ncbi:unnamed protein product [Soboliphyme baturini]|uniref:Uncharacterized protein n=1 Tax=Soboliphyme baturini TaxID=241478 RepID=A0A3P8E8Q7_9BILA|nr:unnamed protein product [Soboliphyme baturini]